jgi:ribosomal-protein-alanine N-acetyltransferase
MCVGQMPKFSGRAGQRVGAESKNEQLIAGVRRFRAADVAVVMKIAEEAPPSANWSRESYVRLSEEEGVSALVIEADGSISGFLVGRRVEDQAEVLNLAVAAQHRRKRLGSALLRAFEEFATRGAKSVYLEVRESNTGAISFYLNHSFAITGRRKGYYRAPDEAAVTMEKKLTG